MKNLRWNFTEVKKHRYFYSLISLAMHEAFPSPSSHFKWRAKSLNDNILSQRKICMYESELLYNPYYYLQAKGSVPIKEYHRRTIQQAGTQTNLQ